MGILEALQYGLSSLNKPGRAVRGLLGGNAREGLAAMPFSDMMGVTDPGDEVTSDHLLRQLGGDPDTDMGTVGSLGLGVATDPLTYAGGFLARRLLGGAAAEAGGAAKAGDIYDLVSPEERALSARNAAFDVEGAFENAPAREMAEGTPRVIHKAELDPYTEAGRDAVMPGDELLRELPPVQHYGFQLGVDQHGVYDPAEHGIASDLLRDGNRAGAWDLHHQQWDQALGDLERLHPNAKMDLQGGFLEPPPELEDDLIRLGHPDSAAADPLGLGDGGTPWRPHYPGSEAGQDWQRVLAQRHGDLDAYWDLRNQIPHVDQNLAQAVEQQHRIEQLLNEQVVRGSQARLASGDIHSGAVRPSQAAGYVDDSLAHLPVDPTAVRKTAAEAQRGDLIEYLTGSADDIGMMSPPEQRHRIEELLAGARQHGGYEPGIIGQTLASPPDTAGGNQLREMLQLLERLRRGG